MNQPPNFPQPPFGAPVQGAPLQPVPANYPQQPPFGVPPQAPLGVPPGAPQYAPGYAPFPQQPQGPVPAPAQALPQNYAKGQADVDSADDEGSEFPKCTWANGMPWYLTLVSCNEQKSFYDGSLTFWISATIRQAPDAQFQPGMTVSVPIKKLGHPTMNNKAQSRLRDFLASCCNEAKIGQAPGHFAGRKQQALMGQLAGAPFVVTFTQKTAKSRNEQTGQFNTYLVPAFQAG